MLTLSLLVMLAQADDLPVRVQRVPRATRPGVRSGGLCPINYAAAVKDTFSGWVPVSVGVAAPTMTANVAPPPSGGPNSADRAQVVACPTAGHVSAIYELLTVPVGTLTSSVWVYGNGSSGNISIYNYDPTAGTGQATSCAYTNGTWTRCSTSRNQINTTMRIGIGCVNDSLFTGFSNTGAADVILWGAAIQVGSTPSCVTLRESYVGQMYALATCGSVDWET